MSLSNHTVILPENFESFVASRLFPGFSGETERRLKRTTIHHLRSRAVAELLWSIEPDLTIVEMARRSEIVKFGCDGQEYDVRTICRWLADLKFDRKPGRPRKKNVYREQFAAHGDQSNHYFPDTCQCR
jgi:hypothetical protein